MRRMLGDERVDRLREGDTVTVWSGHGRACPVCGQAIGRVTAFISETGQERGWWTWEKMTHTFLPCECRRTLDRRTGSHS